MDAIETRVAVLEQIARSTEASLDRIERAIEKLDTRMTARMDRIEVRIETMEARQHANFRWLVGMMFTGFGATIAGFIGLLTLMAHGFRWIP